MTMQLSLSELDFVASQSRTLEDVLDCNGAPVSKYRDRARSLNKDLLLSTPCVRGHRLRTRSGHCAQCDPSKLGYQARHRKAAFVYVAFSASRKLCKVGSSDSPDDRAAKLSYEEVGGSSDWKQLFWVKAVEAGRLESLAHEMLNGHQQRTTYMKDGRTQNSRECFKCRPLVAVKAILDAAENLGMSLKNDWRDRQFDWNAH